MKNKIENEYHDDVTIDDQQLDVEFLEQPKMVAKYMMLAAESKLAVSEAVEEVAIVKATLDRKIKADPGTYDVGKITIDSVMGAVTVHKKYRKAQKMLRKAQYRYQMAQGAVATIESRKSSLEGLTKLLGMDYFAGPATPRDLFSEANLRKRNNEMSNSVIKIGRRSKEDD
jgi:hypothetical protein